MRPVLRGTFKDVFLPCMAWFKRDGGKEQALDTKEPEGAEESSKSVVAVEEKAGSKKSTKVVVTEVDEDANELDEHFSALNLQEVV